MSKVLRGFKIIAGLRDALQRAAAAARIAAAAAKIAQPPIEKEFVRWIDGCCPDCRGTQFLTEPPGDLHTNIRCSGCGSRFSIAYGYPWAARLVMIQRNSRPHAG